MLNVRLVLMGETWKLSTKFPSMEAPRPLIRTMKASNLSMGVETVCPDAGGLGACLGQKRELLGWKVPTAGVFLAVSML